MVTRSLSLVFTASLLGNVAAANPPPITTCIKDMSRVYRTEKLVTDTSIRRVYILCPNTIFSPGIANPTTGVITGGQEPLACKSNCLIKCGNSGVSSNKCTIDGTGTFGIFQIPYNLFDGQPKVSTNVIYQGITVDFFVSSGQIPVLAGAFNGDVTFQDCIFSNNSADPVFVLSEFALPSSARSATIDAPTGKPPGFVWNVTAKDDVMGRNLLEKDAEIIDGPIVHDPTDSTRHHLRAADFPRDDITEIITDEGRVLQTSSGFKVSFQKCVFDVSLNTTTSQSVLRFPLVTHVAPQFNDPVRNAKRQGGLSLIRFEGSTIKESSGEVLERFGSIEATIIDTKFTDNVYNFNNCPRTSSQLHRRRRSN